jgi:hypothetical protein
MTDWHVGTMGFGYKSWKGVLYPADLPDRQQLGYYAGLFNAPPSTASRRRRSWSAGGS